ncbi:hypothetical protein D9611_013459 [Ephemerocybe angulata]|uniref:Zn(2)-C6 fungal-type domain-containing protein n=1 Tax=Ephemerocybe angulata TaxID=980116 RepID=A0A8H5BV63_9AGAR|nr:hypothetical protein D9611_013459 [Tulosesus angulatus]
MARSTFPETDIDSGPWTVAASPDDVGQPLLWPASVYAALQLDVPSHVTDMRSLSTSKLDVETKAPFNQHLDDGLTKPNRPQPYHLPQRHSQHSSAKSPALDRSKKSKRRSSVLVAKPPATPKPPSKALETNLNPKPAPKKACIFCRERKIACGAPPPNAPNQTCNQCFKRKVVCSYPKGPKKGVRRGNRVGKSAEKVQVPSAYKLT